jgi:hypothetical protein
MSQYEQRDTEQLGELYLVHVEAMTTEGLHEKSAIAAELAHRDSRIKELESRLTAINNAIYAAGAPLGGDNYFAIREIASKHLRE